MASTIKFIMNNLTVEITGLAGYMDSISYTNLDPVNYVFQIRNRRSKAVYNFTFIAGTTEPATLTGFRRMRTDEVMSIFQGAYLPT